MLYNDIIGYSQSGVSYEGILTLSIPGFSNILLSPSISVHIGDEEDFSNLTTIGVATVVSVKTGSMTLETTERQAELMAQSSLIYLSKSASTSIDKNSLEEGTLVQISVVSRSQSAEQNLA